jgi:hypothetical protein
MLVALVALFCAALTYGFINRQATSASDSAVNIEPASDPMMNEVKSMLCLRCEFFFRTHR